MAGGGAVRLHSLAVHGVRDCAERKGCVTTQGNERGAVAHRPELKPSGMVLMWKVLTRPCIEAAPRSLDAPLVLSSWNGNVDFVR